MCCYLCTGSEYAHAHPCTSDTTLLCFWVQALYWNSVTRKQVSSKAGANSALLFYWQIYVNNTARVLQDM